MNEHITESIKNCFYEVFGTDGSDDSFKTFSLSDSYYGDIAIRFTNKYSDYIVYLGYNYDNDNTQHRSHLFMLIDGEYTSIDKFDTKKLVKTLTDGNTHKHIKRFILNSIKAGKNHESRS